MTYYVNYGRDYYGPYDTWEKAYFFALENFGFNGWRIYDKRSD